MQFDTWANPLVKWSVKLYSINWNMIIQSADHVMDDRANIQISIPANIPSWEYFVELPIYIDDKPIWKKIMIQ